MPNESSSKCNCRTINLAKEGHTLEERRCKLLIFEKKYPVAPPSGCGPPLELGLKETHPSAKRVRICTAADIRTTCPPPVCTCPPMTPPLTLMQILQKIAGLGLRCAVVAGVVYATYETGVWGDAKSSECLFVNMKNMAIGTDYSCAEDGAPRVDRLMHRGRQTWNSMITCAFKCISDLNDKMRDAVAPEREDCVIDKKKKK